MQLVNLFDNYKLPSLKLFNSAITALIQKKAIRDDGISVKESLHQFIINIDDYTSELRQEIKGFTFFHGKKTVKLNGAILLKATVESLMKLDNSYADKLNTLQTHLNTHKQSLEGGENSRFKLLIESFQELVKIARQKYPAAFFGADLNLEDNLRPHGKMP